MLCFEVAVNGERFCLAGGDRLSILYANVASRGSIGRLLGSTFDLNVSGLPADNVPVHQRFPFWGERSLNLNIGDVVTVRMVESTAPDPPRYRLDRLTGGTVGSIVTSAPTPEPQLFAYTATIPDGLGGFLFWVAVAVLGILSLYFTPHG